MQNKLAIVLSFVVITLMVFLTGCGGSKETVKYEPDPFPEPEPEIVEEAPVTAIETPEPVIEDIAIREPLILITINFDFDKANLTEEAKAILAENARRLLENPEVRVRIEGHCDENGTVEYNLALGQRRAIVTRNYLINFGLNPDNFTIISYGKERPVDSRHTAEAWSKNRRADFIKMND